MKRFLLFLYAFISFYFLNKGSKLNGSVLSERNKLQKNKGNMFKSSIDHNNISSEVTTLHLNSVDKARDKKQQLSPINYPSSAQHLKKKLSSGVAKRFDKAIALTSRVARVFLDNKKQGVINGATGSSLSYTQGINTANDSLVQHNNKIPKPKVMISKHRFTNTSKASNSKPSKIKSRTRFS